MLIVSDGIIAESESLGIRASDQASLAPERRAGFASRRVDGDDKLMATNSRALLYEREYGFVMGRANSVASLSGVNY